MAQRLLHLLAFSAVLFLTNAQLASAQDRNPYKILRAAIGTPVLDTISGVNLDINPSNPLAKHGSLDVRVIAPSSANTPTKWEVSYTPNPGFVGVDTFVLEYRTANNFPYQAYEAFRVEVWPSLVTANQDYAISNGSSVTLSVLDNDYGTWGPLTLSSISLVNNGVAEIQNNQIVFTPEPGFLGIAHLNYSVCDALLTCKTGSASIGVNNGQPSTEPLQFFTKKDNSIEFPLTFEGYTLVQPPQNGVAKVLKGRAASYVPNPGFAGFDQFILKTNHNGLDYFKTIKVKVYDAKSNKMAMDDLYFTPKNTPITFNLRQNDIGNLLVKSWSVPNNFPGTLSGFSGSGNVVFTPKPGFTGVASFSYKIGNNYSSAVEMATVTIAVDNLIPMKQLPNAIHTPMETPVVLKYDIPYSNFEFEILEIPIHGTVEYFPGVTTQTFNGKSVTGYNILVYHPHAGYTGPDDFTLQYCLPNGECSISKVNFKVDEINTSNPPFCVLDCAWPGDVNNDGIVSNKDLLPLGYVIGMDGPARTQGDASWYGQYSNDWNNPFGGIGKDMKFADIDGNSDINEADAAIISENYRQVHNLLPKIPELNKGLPFELKLLTPAPEFGDPIKVEISLGHDLTPALDIYGFTFSMVLGQGMIDSAYSMTFLDNSWLNQNAPNLQLSKRAKTGKFDLAFTRTNGQPISGQGVIGSMDFIIIDIVDVGGQNERPGITLYPTIMLADGTTSEGAPITLEIPLKPKDRNDQHASPLGEIAVYPIPAQNLLFVELPENERIETITLMDLQGKVLLSQSDFNSNQTRLNIAELNNGMYILTAKTASDIRMTKVQILR